MRLDRWFMRVTLGLVLAVGGSLLATGCSNTAATQLPEPTDAGVPDGAAVSATVGPDGGTLVSADGVLTVTVPAGALAEDTTVTIQPITNLAHGGIGAAYRLTPEGQTFAQSVTLTFAYTAADLVGGALEVLGVAYQTSGGYWEWVADPVRDPTAQTVSVKTSHFSDWSLVWGAQLLPHYATVRPGATLSVYAVSCYNKTKEPLPLWGYNCHRQGSEGITALSWQVNGVKGGNQTVGLVEGNPRSVEAIYTAPSTAPQPNLVAVAVETTLTGFGKVLLQSNVTVGAPKRLLILHHVGHEVTAERNSVQWTGGDDRVDIMLPGDGLQKDYGVGGADGPIPEKLLLLNTTTEKNSYAITAAPCLTSLPPQEEGQLELLTVDRVTLSVSPSYSSNLITFEGNEDVPLVRVGDATCQQYLTGYPAFSLRQTVRLKVSRSVWEEAESGPVSVTSTDGNWSGTLRRFD